MISKTWELLSIGSDESGKGDFFGAPSVVAVKLDQKTLDTLKELDIYTQIKDSKALEDSAIKVIAPKIRKICEYKSITLNPTQYNQLYQNYQNLNTLLSLLHNKVHKAIEGDEPRVIDAFAPKVTNYYSYLDKEGESKVSITHFTTKADSKFLSVALASIIARDNYITQMEELSLKSGVNLPYGNAYSGRTSVFTAYKALLANGISSQEIENDYVKANFSTLKKIKESL